MNDIIIQAYSNRKLSKKTVDIGNMQENQVTKLIFELDKDIVALGGNVYLFVSYEGSTYPYPLTNNTFEVGRELTQRKKADANLVVSTSTDTDNVLDGVVWISNTLTLLVDKNSINIESINEGELPPSLKIVYDNLLNLEKDLQEKKDSDYWRGEPGPQGPPGESSGDALSPTATVEQTENGAVITIIDKNGETTATVYNGKDGKNGSDGADGYTPVKGKDYFTDADKQEIINEIFEQVTNGNEVAY